MMVCGPSNPDKQCIYSINISWQGEEAIRKTGSLKGAGSADTGPARSLLKALHGAEGWRALTGGHRGGCGWGSTSAGPSALRRMWLLTVSKSRRQQQASSAQLCQCQTRPMPGTVRLLKTESTQESEHSACQQAARELESVKLAEAIKCPVRPEMAAVVSSSLQSPHNQKGPRWPTAGREKESRR